MGFNEVLAVFKKELKVIIRERRLLAILIIQPIVLISVFGYAFSGEIKDVPTAVIYDDSSRISKQLISLIASSDVLDVQYWLATESEAREMIKTERFQWRCTSPKDFRMTF